LTGTPNLIANRGATLPQQKARQGVIAAQHDVLREETKKLAAEAQASSADPSSAGSRLAEITRLHEAGLLTDEEYQAKRAEIISQL
jgi:Short C-terminal domain